jgi:hypothetical protein
MQNVERLGPNHEDDAGVEIWTIWDAKFIKCRASSLFGAK